MAERLKPKPGGASSREDKTATLPPAETDVKKTAGRQRATGSYDPRQSSDKPASEHRSYSGTDGRRLQMSKSRVNAVEDGGGRYTQPVEVIPESKVIAVNTARSKTDRLPDTTASGGSDNTQRSKMLDQFKVRSSRPGRVERVPSRPGDELQVTVSPPLSPPVDDTTVKHKPLPSRFSPLPSQALSSVATGTKGSTKSSTKGTTGASSNKPAPLSLGRSSSPSAQSRGYQSLHSPSSTSSGNLSSGGDLLSGGLSSDEHMIAQAHSLDGKARVVAGTGQPSFGINPQDYTPTGEHRQPSSLAEDSAPGTISTQATDRRSETNGQEGTCCDKMLLATNSIGMTGVGRPVFNTSLSDDTALRYTRSQYQALERIVQELESKNAALQGQLDEQNRDSLEQGHNYRQEFDRLVSEVSRLSPFEEQVAHLKEELKCMEERYEQAKGIEARLVEQVSLVSLRESEIETLKKCLDSESDEQKLDSRKEKELNKEISRLKDQVEAKNCEIARVKARLKKQKSRSADDDATVTSTMVTESVRTEFEEKLKRKDIMIARLKKKVTEQAEAAQLEVPPSLGDVAAVDTENLKEANMEQDSCVKTVQANKQSTSAVVDNFKDQQDGIFSQDNPESLRKAVKERDQKIKMLSDQLQSFMHTASNVEKISRHAKEQSGEIARLRSQLQDTEAEHKKSAQQCSSIQSEHDAMQVKLAQSIQTVRGLTLERQKLEEENKRLLAEAHGYANTKLDEAEKNNESLREEVSEYKKKIADMTVKVNELATQKAACEEKNHAMATILKSLEHTKHNLKQKDVEQQALIQNLQQDLQRVEQKASENAVLVEKYQMEIQDQQKQIQELIGEKEAAKAMADIYKEDFKNERKDRERAHTKSTELEERSKAEVSSLKEQLQRVSADNGRLTKVMREREGQMKTEIATLKKRIEEQSQERDALKAEMVVLDSEVQSKTQQVKQYKKQVDQFKVELDRYQVDMKAFIQQAELHKQQIEIVVKEKEVSVHASRSLELENEHLKKEINILKAREHLARHGQGQQGSIVSAEEFMLERRKHEDATRMVKMLERRVDEIQTEKVILISENEDLKGRLGFSQQPAGKIPPTAGHRGHGGSALPTPMRPVVAHHHLNQGMKSASVDSPDVLNSRGHIDPPRHRPPAPPPPISTFDPRAQPPIVYANQPPQPQRYVRRSLTSTIDAPQRDSPFQPNFSNAEVTHGGGYPFANTYERTNADFSGGRGLQTVMGSPPSNAKRAPSTSAGATTTAKGTSTGYALTSPRPSPAPAPQHFDQKQHGQHFAPQGTPGYPHSSVGSSNVHVVPPFTAHGHNAQAMAYAPSHTVAVQPPAQHHHNRASYAGQQQHFSPPPDEGSGHMSLPSFGSGSSMEQKDHTLSPDHVSRSSHDDLYLHKQQKQLPPGYQQHSVHIAFDEVEKDSSPPTSMVPASQGGQPLSFNPQVMSQGLYTRPPQHQRRSHQVPLSPDHSKQSMDFGGRGRAPAAVQADSSEPSSSSGRDMLRINKGGTYNHPRVQSTPHNLPQQPAVKAPYQESNKQSRENKPIPAVYVPSNKYGAGGVREPDSDPASQHSLESGREPSSIGGSQVNLNENTLEKGIDRDIRRAASNIKKQIGGRDSPAGVKGRVEMAPYDPNLVCPSCGYKFRIGEIQKFKRHAATCTGT